MRRALPLSCKHTELEQTSSSTQCKILQMLGAKCYAFFGIRLVSAVVAQWCSSGVKARQVFMKAGPTL